MFRPLLLALVVSASACQAPRLITSMTATPGKMTMVYSQAGGARTGVIQCARTADGSLTNCKRVPITFNDGRGGGQ